MLTATRKNVSRLKAHQENRDQTKPEVIRSRSNQTIQGGWVAYIVCTEEITDSARRVLDLRGAFFLRNLDRDSRQGSRAHATALALPLEKLGCPNFSFVPAKISKSVRG
jgi:hypothetical protein